ncbi:MAG: DUF362 domain-containing protein [Sedimentisphaerales bacterium]|nr:DUF362 domain-containing protein [Sedimentisphaerales bacterium]
MDKENPFFSKLERIPVAVAHGEGAYQNTLKALESINLEVARGKRVLLKPNAGRLGTPGSGITTDPEVVGAAIDAFRKVGANVAVGESPITGIKTMEAFETTGIAEQARKRDCPLIDMDARSCVEIDIPSGVVINKLKLCPEVLEFDYIVSIPVMKMHMHTDVTLAVKNMKGCLWRRSKVQLHMLPPYKGSNEKSLNVAIADMTSVLVPHLSIIDGSIGMEGLGPSAGTPKKLDCVVVSADAFAADAVACQLMGTRAEDVPYLRMGAERGFGVIDMDKIDVSPDNWTDWCGQFAKPPENITIEYPNVKVLDNNSCSACQSTVLLFLKEYGDKLFDYLPKGEILHIAIGKGHTELPEKTLCVGNCTARFKNSHNFLHGCPPVASEILKKLIGKTSYDSKQQDDNNGTS